MLTTRHRSMLLVVHQIYILSDYNAEDPDHDDGDDNHDDDDCYDDYDEGGDKGFGVIIQLKQRSFEKSQLLEYVL
ncbi:hypothetical protein ElyMa_004686500 [Elysia marginata]|uniref:Uncharacterized protein n=1 Tax=Elysia marginata TaxID=1093978 RepID=A0AAV4I9G6_9GAST|nr:hypothetical protein ElyMa_004686500 [Elysia marginata]